MLLSNFNPPIRLAISFHGPMNLVKYAKYNLDNPDGPRWAEKLVHQLVGGKIEDLQKNAKEASPFHLANKKTAPILFIASKNDLTVPYQYAEQTYKKLKKLGVPTKILIHPSNFHGDVDPVEVKKRGWPEMWNKKNPPKVMFHNEVLKFLKKYLV